MKQTMKLKYTLLGALLAVMALQLCVPALAALAKKTVDIYTGVSIYVDDVKLSPKDANGNPVEVFVYNGTTYLPVRAVGEAFGKVVQWDGATESVYLGKHSSETPAVLLQNLDYFTGKKLVAYTSDQDNLGNAYSQSCSSQHGDPLDNVYKLNGQYSKLTGTFYQRYEYRSSDIPNNLKLYGDGKLLFDGTVRGGIEPIFFDVNLSGVLELRIQTSSFSGVGFGFQPRAAIGDCALYS